MTIRINASELHQRVGDILAQIRYTGERVIIERRGIPVAAVISIEDLERLPTRSASVHKLTKDERRAALQRAVAVQQLILKQRKGKRVTDSAKLIREMREQRARHIANSR